MNTKNPFLPAGPRAGKQHRTNPERFFHVMGQGWYVLTREGVNGPYNKKPEAENYVRALCGVRAPGSVSESNWRFKPL